MGKDSRNRILIYWLLLACFWLSVRASESPLGMWNGDVQIPVLTMGEFEKVQDGFPMWKAKQMVWPTPEEVNIAQVEVAANVKETCSAWLRRFVDGPILPIDINDHLIPMKQWGRMEAKGLSDVFVTRFMARSVSIHIYETPYNIVLGVVKVNVDNPVEDHVAYVTELASIVLTNSLRPEPNSDVVSFPIPNSARKMTRVIWMTSGVLAVDANGVKCANMDVAVRNGAVQVEAETDGRFVRFEIVKYSGGPRAFADPYVKRF